MVLPAMEHYLALYEILMHAITWMNTKYIMLS